MFLICTSNWNKKNKKEVKQPISGQQEGEIILNFDLILKLSFESLSDRSDEIL